MSNTDYGAQSIKVLEGLEPVRQRPWMYIWSTDARGLHHMVYEIVDNAVDEALAWYCHNIVVILHKDWYVSVYDDGRWIPTDIHPKTWKSALETVFTVLHAGWKFDKSVYKVSGGLHGVWASVVNALSEHLIVEVHRNGKIYRQEYRRWKPLWPVQEVGSTNRTWTMVKFKPDPEIFETVEFNASTILTRLKHSAYLTPGVSFTLIDERSDLRQRFYFQWWIKTWLWSLTFGQKTISPPFYLNQEGQDVLIEIAFQFLSTNNSVLLSFVNNIHTPDWWTHVVGFKNALVKVVNEIAQSKGLIDKKIGQFQISDIMEWLYGIISVKVPEPQFEWQTKWRLGNSYVKKEVEKAVYEYLKKYFSENEDIFNQIVEKVKLSAKARVAAKLARETVLRKSALSGGVLPGKLADCSIKKKEWTELFIVEWNSAWWSAKQGRDSSFQAILPLKGKILNTEQAPLQKIMQNNEIKSLIMAIGAWIKEAYDEDKLRYDKIIIMTDADVDWAHIRTLLLTFFFRYMRPLIENGHLYIAVPPLYKIKQGKKEVYIYPPEDDLDAAIKKYWFDPNKNIEIQRYKGLWEMNPEQLWQTTMNPQTRKLLKVTIQDAENADKLFRILMGEDVSSRKHFILTHAKNVKELDI